MKKRTIMNGFYGLSIFAISFCFTSCGEDTVPVVETGDITYRGINTFKADGKIVDDGGSPILEKGIVYDRYDPDLNNGKFTTEGKGDGDFTSHVTDISSTSPLVRAYATNEIGTAYGEAVKFEPMMSNPLEYNGYLYYVNPYDEGSYEWSAGSDDITLGQSVTDGAKNTEELAGDSERQASDYCHGLVEHGFDDWFLPAKEELEFLFENKDATGLSEGHWSGYEYWSSTQIDEDRAYSYIIVENTNRPQYKTTEAIVRCVRKEKP